MYSQKIRKGEKGNGQKGPKDIGHFLFSKFRFLSMSAEKFYKIIKHDASVKSDMLSCCK